MNIYKKWVLFVAFAALFSFPLFPNLSFAHEGAEMAPVADDPSIQSDMSLLSSLLNGKSLESTTDTVSIFKRRKEILLDLAEKSPVGFLTVAMPDAERTKLISTVREQVEKKETITGDLQVLHVDDFSKPENSHFEYFISSGDTRYELHTPANITTPANSKVSVSGFVLDNVMVANNTAIRTLSSASKLDSVGAQKTAVLLVDYADSGPQPFTPSFLKSYIFSGVFEKFYVEQSYSQVSFTGDVFGWFTLPRNAGGVCGDVSFDDVAKMLTAKKINLSKYTRLLIIPTGPNLVGGCSYVGRSNITIGSTNYKISVSWVGGGAFSEPSLWGAQPFTWTNLDYVLAHELGHALGLQHANGWDCDTVSINGNCDHLEYGNLFDTMGSGGYSLHFNAMYKELLGWLPSSRVAVLKPGATATLSPLENPKGIVLLKVPTQPKSGNFPYYLEFRQPLGFDRNLNNPDLSSNQQGIFINKKINIDPTYFFSRVLDARPTDGYWWEDIKQATLNNSTFFDPGRGLTIQSFPASKTGSSGATVTARVTYQTPECTHFAPRISYAYSPSQWSPVAAGSSTYISINFVDEDYFACGQTTFNSQVTAPTGFNLDYGSEADATINPEDSGYFFQSVSIPENTPDGEYEIQYTLTNAGTGLDTSINIPIQVGSN